VANVNLMVCTSDGLKFTGSEGPMIWSDRDNDEGDDISINSSYHEPNIALSDDRNTVAGPSNTT
jgi:hypothetical protein